MSTLTDFFTSLANKIRSKTGSTEVMSPMQMIDAIDDIYTPTQTKTVTAGTSATTVLPDNGFALSSVTVNPTPTQTKSVSSSTSAQTVTPDSGKYLSSVSISAISPQRSSGTAASAAGRDNTGPYVYFPYGWWGNYSSERNYTRLTEAQGILVARKQEKTITSSRSAQTVTPDSNYLLSKVTVNALSPTGTYPANERNSQIDMGATSNYRYVNTTNVPNSNSGTYTPTSDSSAHDMGATNTYRYVNTNTVYNSGLKMGYRRNQYYGKSEWAGTGTSHEFTFNGLIDSGRYFYVCMIQQTGGTYSGHGSGAISYAEGSGVDSHGSTGWEQLSCQTVNTQGLGGMVMRSYGAFDLSNGATSANIWLVPVNNITGYWCVYLWGSY